MARSNMALDVLVRLRDLMSGPLKRLSGTVNSFTGAVKKIGLVGTAIAGLSFTAPIAQAAEFQQKLLDIAGTAELTHQAAFNFVNEQKVQYEGLAFAYGQFSDTIAEGAGQMIAAGIEQADVSGSLATIAKNSTAANAQFSDMAGVATSLIQTLRVPVDQLDGAMAGLIVSGKLGAFEMKDMARHFPTLTSQVAKFGVVGREAVNFLGAALQIAKKGTADPAEAANNLKNFLSKILAPATIKNFQEAGVDIEAVMKDAATKGINPIEAVVQKISKLSGASGKEIEKLMLKAEKNGLKGADALAMVRDELVKIHGAGKLGELFQDQQVMDFLIPMLANVDEYKRIKEQVAAATGATAQADFETQMQGLNRQFVEFQETGVQAVREVGLAFGTWLPQINQYLQASIKWLREMDEKTGGNVRKALAFAGAAIALVTALGILGTVLSVVATGLSVLLSPAVLVVAALAAAGAAIYYYWEPIKSTVLAVAGMVAKAFNDIVEAGKTIASQMWQIGVDIAQNLWEGIKERFNAVIDWFRSIPEQIRQAIGSIDISSMVHWPSLPSWLGGSGSTPPPAQPPTGANQNIKVDNTLTVKAAPGTTVTESSTKTNAPNASSSLNTGRSVGRY